jgi:hypothetical protein
MSSDPRKWREAPTRRAQGAMKPHLRPTGPRGPMGSGGPVGPVRSRIPVRSLGPRRSRIPVGPLVPVRLLSPLWSRGPMRALGPPDPPGSLRPPGRVMERLAWGRLVSQRSVVRSSSRRGWSTSTQTPRSAPRLPPRVGTTDPPGRRVPRRPRIAAGRRARRVGRTLPRRTPPPRCTSTIRLPSDSRLQPYLPPSPPNPRPPPHRGETRTGRQQRRGPSRLSRWACRRDHHSWMAGAQRCAMPMHPMTTWFPIRTQPGRDSSKGARETRRQMRVRRPRAT